jgi:hypothetical protein
VGEGGGGEVLTFGYLVFVWMLFHLPITSIHLTILAWMSKGFIIIIVCKAFMLVVCLEVFINNSFGEFFYHIFVTL